MKIKSVPEKVGIIGAGPAGLTAAYLLTQAGVKVFVLESDPQYVGGISRTVNFKGFYFDIGGHRFFSKSKRVEDFWSEILPDDMLDRPRSSRIYYNGKFFSYPLKAFEALFKLGLWNSILCVASYAKARIHPVANPRTFQDWVTNQFGERLFKIFFKTYTEKVWGMPCDQISADWAAQRIQGLSLFKAVYYALLPKPKSRDKVVKTLIDTFRYPRRGPGMMWEACAEKVAGGGGEVHLGQQVTRVHYDGAAKKWELTSVDESGKTQTWNASDLISSAPLRDLVREISPSVSAKAKDAAEQLKYRDFITVVLILEDRAVFDDNWIYIHDPSVKVGRIQNFKSWSPEMVPDPRYVSYGLEYFCFEGDGLWTSTDEALVEIAKTELEKIGLGKRADVRDGCVVRQKKAYPVYDDLYADNVAVIAAELSEKFPHLHLVGRNGMHKYNNQDHAMMTAMLTVENLLSGEQKYDVWQVNQDAEYHEAGKAGEEMPETGLRQVPRALKKVAGE